MEDMFSGAADLEVEEVPMAANMGCWAITGVTRTVFEQNAGLALIRKLQRELLLKCRSYV